jgi:hypothetical protein
MRAGLYDKKDMGTMNKRIESQSKDQTRPYISWRWCGSQQHADTNTKKQTSDQCNKVQCLALVRSGKETEKDIRAFPQMRHGGFCMKSESYHMQ